MAWCDIGAAALSNGQWAVGFTGTLRGILLQSLAVLACRQSRRGAKGVDYKKSCPKGTPVKAHSSQLIAHSLSTNVAQTYLSRKDSNYHVYL